MHEQIYELETIITKFYGYFGSYALDVTRASALHWFPVDLPEPPGGKYRTLDHNVL